MPYIHWETRSRALGIKQFLKNLEHPQPQVNDKLEDFICAYLSKESLAEYNPLHLRRTLDQYCYYTLESTIDRDEDQLLSRVFSSRELKSQQVAINKKLYDIFEPHKPILMVDQLWLWVLNNSKLQPSLVSAVQGSVLTCACRYHHFMLPREVEPPQI